MNLNDFFRIDQDPATGIAELVLNRPERMNTMAPAFFPALRDAVQAPDDAGATRVLVVRGEGKHFCAGMSLDTFAPDGAMQAMLDTGSARKRLAFQTQLRRLMASFDALEAARFPVVCAVQGACVGGALDLAGACDLRVCAAGAFFTVQEIHIGMAGDLGVLQRLQRLLPQGLARELAYTGDRLGAERALATGFVNAVAPDADALLAHARKLAAAIGAKSPLAIAASKVALNHARDHGTADSLEHMALLQSAVFDIDEMARAIAAWQSKKPAGFDPLGEIARP
ncbi:MAG: enoyl-CoA hydratase/isomerase family protein [Caulobacter sp.]|nr:enoyl-CoA hydratase/isomerase family protein [Vitreoscilla sp.]